MLRVKGDVLLPPVEGIVGSRINGKLVEDLRKAVGAKRKHILVQFLIESSVLCALGGVLGLLLAAGVSWLISATTPVPMSMRETRSELSCPSCGAKRFQVFARFEYPPDLTNDVSEDWHGKEQDLFSWFTLVVECGGCGHRGVIADEECA